MFTAQPTAILLAKGRPHSPHLSVAVSLTRQGYRTRFVASSCDGATRRYLEAHGIPVTELQPGQPHPQNVVKKLGYWWEFRTRAWSLLQSAGPVDLLWVGTADTALALGRRLLTVPYVFQILELYDTFPYYRKHLRDYARGAQAVVVPEANRAAIFRSWYQLPSTPFVLPNKPLEHPRRRKMPITSETARKLIESIPAGTRLVMYQGIIHAERDIRPVGQAVAALGAGWKFVVVGDDQGFLKPLQAACPEMLHVPYVSPPYHLEVTSHAAVGVLAYCFDNMNNLFCAPNKVWEYAGFGLPMLGNDVPGLSLIESHQAGLCVDFHNPRAVQRGLMELVQGESQFAAGSAVLYDRFDVGELVADIASAVAPRRAA